MKEKTNPDLDFPIQPPEVGEGVEIAAGVYWLRLPIPFELNHINVWLLDDGDGYTLVDTGIYSKKTCAAWEDLLEKQFNDKPINRIIVTHFHPDHFGLVGWLKQKFDASYMASRETESMTEYLFNPAEQHSNELRREFYSQHNLTETKDFEEFLQGYIYTQIVSGSLVCDQYLVDGDCVVIGESEWRVMMGYGHAPGHVTLYSEKLDMLISGDQVLPTITSNVSVHATDPDKNPLLEFLDSFIQYQGLPEDTLVLPAHGKVFQGLHVRVEQIVQHHERVLEKVYDFCEQPHGVLDLMPHLFKRKLEGMNLVLGFGEALAHLNYLYLEGKIKRELEQGCYRYQR